MSDQASQVNTRVVIQYWNNLNPVMLTCVMQVAQMLHTNYHMTLRPYHSHHSLQKQVRRRTFSTAEIL
jgi:hypothetical protein